MTEQMVLLSVDDRIATLTLNRPQARNSLSQGMIDAFSEKIAQANAIDNIRVVIIKANGPGFCAGHDLKEMDAKRADEDGGKAYFDQLFASCSALMMAVVNSPKIFIASVHGVATAAGCQLVAACDMAIASEQVKFGVNGINAGLFCSTPMVSLSRNAGRKAAMELLTTGRMMSAGQAEQAGIINRVVGDNELSQAVDEMAAMVAEKPAEVLALGKKAFYTQLEMPLEQAYEHTSDVIIDNVMLPAAVEGISAFVAKRKPDWK